MDLVNLFLGEGVVEGMLERMLERLNLEIEFHLVEGEVLWRSVQNSE